MRDTVIGNYLKELESSPRTKERGDDTGQRVDIVFEQLMYQLKEGFDMLPTCSQLEQRIHIVKVLAFTCCQLRQIFSVSLMNPSYYAMLTQGLNTAQHLVRDPDEAFEVRAYATGCLKELLELFSLDNTLSPINRFRKDENALGYHCADIAAFVNHMLQRYGESDTGL